MQVGTKKTRERIRTEKECQSGRGSVNNILSEPKEGDVAGELPLN